MFVVDVNLLIYAVNADAAEHATATKIEKPRTSCPQGTGPVVPVIK